uniref:Proline-rich AKT1 substrate 1 N-terminal domain-containing protein n=1 Tax=Terrapene triunguis TaxID=2587831 RepID=A0A674J0T0_9SAUR
MMTGMADNHRESWAGLVAEAERYRRRTGNEVVLITAYRAPQPGGFAYTQHGCGALGDAARRYLEDIAVVHKTTAFTYAARPPPAPRPPPSPYSRSCPPQDPPAGPHWTAGAQGAPAEAAGGQEEEEEEEEKNVPAPREMEAPGKQQPPSDTTGESVPPMGGVCGLYPCPTPEGTHLSARQRDLCAPPQRGRISVPGGGICAPHPRGDASRCYARGPRIPSPSPEGLHLGTRQGDLYTQPLRPTPERATSLHRARGPRIPSPSAPPQRWSHLLTGPSAAPQVSL